MWIKHNLLNSAADGDGFEFTSNMTVKIKARVHVTSSLQDGVDNSGYTADLYNFGRISAQHSDGVDLNQALDSLVVNELGGVITGRFAVDDEGTGDIIKNHGHITGAFTGVLLGGLSDGGDLLNYGSIRGGSFGVQELSNNTGGAIVNYGKISSAQTGLEVWTNTDLTTSIVNKASGVISGHTHAIFVNTQGGVSLANYGTINGNIDCNSDSGDAIHNHGMIHGIVELYSRSDFFDGRGGTSGAIFCAGNDHVIAGNGSVSIHAGVGESTLTGGSGHDSFFFDVALDTAVQPTVITNFAHGMDKIVLSEAIFGGLGPHGKLGAAHFHVGDPVNSVAQIDYNPSTGELDYRAHGNAGPAIDFATLINVPSITAGDFHLVA